MAPWIVEHLPPHDVYVEPFGGMASVLLAKEPIRLEVYNDVNYHLATLFGVLRDEAMAEELHHKLERTEYSRALFHEARDALRSGKQMDPVDHAWNFSVIGLMAFSGNGSQKTASFSTLTGRGGANPAGTMIHAVDRLPLLARRLRGVYVENQDALKVIAQFDAVNTLFYLDPPYVGHEHEYADSIDHDELVETLLSIQGMAVLSGVPNDTYTRLDEHGWRQEHKLKLVTADRRPQERRSTMEVIWINPAAAACMRQVKMF